MFNIPKGDLTVAETQNRLSGNTPTVRIQRRLDKAFELEAKDDQIKALLIRVGLAITAAAVVAGGIMTLDETTKDTDRTMTAQQLASKILGRKIKN